MKVYGSFQNFDFPRIGRGLDADWTRIGRGFDADSTRIRRGLDADSTRIGRGFWIAHRLYTNCTRIGLGLDADSKKGNYLLTKEGPVQFVPKDRLRKVRHFKSARITRLSV